jgi:hypothetical protein
MRLTLTLALLVLSPLTTAAQSLEGAWTLEQMEVTGGDRVGTFTPPELMIFTKTHYSFMWISANVPRPQLRDGATTVERLAAFTAFFGNGGTYTLEGSTLTMQVSIAQIPNTMNTSGNIEVRFERDDTMWLTLGNGIQKWMRAE